jgi:GNAT superfamily N-acetyltransferase
MNIVAVTAQNAAAFAPLAPAGFDFIGEGRRALGAAAEIEGVTSAVGVLHFSLTEGAGEDTSLTLAVVDWLYVDPRFRRQGAGALLLDELFDLLYRLNAGDSGVFVDGILCDISLDDEYNVLCAFFEDFDFESGLVDLYDGQFTLRDFTGHGRLTRQNIGGHIKPLGEIPAVFLTMYLSEKDGQEDVARILSPDPLEYDRTLSFVSLTEGGLDGAFLVRRVGASGALEPLFLNGNSGKTCGDLVCAAVRAAETSYPPETSVTVRCLSESSATLLSNLFPGISPALVRRVLYSLGEEASRDEGTTLADLLGEEADSHA